MLIMVAFSRGTLVNLVNVRSPDQAGIPETGFLKPLALRSEER